MSAQVRDHVELIIPVRSLLLRRSGFLINPSFSSYCACVLTLESACFLRGLSPLGGLLLLILCSVASWCGFCPLHLCLPLRSVTLCTTATLHPFSSSSNPTNSPYSRMRESPRVCSAFLT